MTPGDDYSSVALHDVAELADPDWTDAGDELRRVPSAVAANLNVAARDRIRHPAGSEIRFVPRGTETVRVTLSAAAETVVRPFWGSFQGEDVLELGPEPAVFELSVPEPLTDLSPDAAVEAASAFDPWVCRLRFEPWAPVALHEVAGECRPPADAETPDRRYLAYGTSITEGAAASATHLNYVSRVARNLDLDPVNLGMSGAAYCEPAVADHIAQRDDWDVATLALSVNMANRGFTVAQFRERADYLVERVAGANPDRPVVCATLFPYHADLRESGDGERARAYREALESVVAGCDSGNVSVVDGRALSSADGLTTDLLHPGDAGMASIADGLCARVGDALDG